MDHGLGPTRGSNAGSVNTKPLVKRVSLFWECHKGVMAEEQGFEPWEDFHPRRFSRPVHSTTLPLLRQALPSVGEKIPQAHF